MNQRLVEPTLSLSDEQIAFYSENGFLVLDAITTLDEVATIREVYDRLFEERVGREEGNQFDLGGVDEEGIEAKLPQILAPEKYAPELQNTLYKANAKAIAVQLLGLEATGEFGHAIRKPPGIGAPTPIHQDEAYWDPGKLHNGISIWMPLQEATVENGCMHFVPGSFRRGVVPHRSINNDPRIHGLEVDPDVADIGELVACPIPAGGVTIHHCRTLHYAGPNRSDDARRAYILVFNVEPEPLPERRNFYWQDAWETARQARADEAKAGPRD